METEDFGHKPKRLNFQKSEIAGITIQYPKESSKLSNKMLKVMTSLLLVFNLVSLGALVEGAMSLPDGIENILGFVPRSTFKCERDGYFGDIDNDCRIFHLCQKQVHPNGRTEWSHWTYACGNQTMFNQLTLTCAFVDEAIPCKHASQFQYLNEVIHKPREPFLTDADVTSGISYYNNRVMSDGARARAFEDSQLMAQLGGPNLIQQAQPQVQIVQPKNSNNLIVSNHHQQHQQQHHFSQNSFASSLTHSPVASGAHSSLRREAEASSAFSADNSIEQPLSSIQSDANSFLANFPASSPQQLTVIPLDRPTNQQGARSNQEQGVQVSAVQFPQVQFLPAPVANPQQPAQRQQQQQQSHAPKSFEFSIATNHQQGAAAPTSVFINNLPLPQLAPAAAVPAASTSELARSLPTTLAPVSAPTTTRQQQPITATTATTTTTTTISTPTSGAILRSPAATSEAPVAVTTRQTNMQPQQQQPRRRQVTTRTGSIHHNQGQNQRQRQHLLDHQLNGLFQSNRLASAAPAPGPTRSQQNQQQQPALVMRRQVAGQTATLDSQGTTSSQAGPSTPFWRQTLNGQPMAHRFESMLTRRRV